MYSIFGWGYGQVKVNVLYVYVVFRECARAMQGWIWRLQSYVCLYTWKQAGCELWCLDVYLGLYWRAYTREILTCTWSCTGKQLNVNCGAIYINGDYNGG